MTSETLHDNLLYKLATNEITFTEAAEVEKYFSENVLSRRVDKIKDNITKTVNKGETKEEIRTLQKIKAADESNIEYALTRINKEYKGYKNAIKAAITKKDFNTARTLIDECDDLLDQSIDYVDDITVSSFTAIKSVLIEFITSTISVTALWSSVKMIIRILSKDTITANDIIVNTKLGKNRPITKNDELKVSAGVIVAVAAAITAINTATKIITKNSDESVADAITSVKKTTKNAIVAHKRELYRFRACLPIE